ncbi:hypothetical protein ACI6Q2_18140 [Chitinophagaceae bacterium LWZ2-11]
MKILASTILLFSIIALSSCTKTVQGPTQSFVVTGSISSNQWQRTTDNLGYFVSLNTPDVTPDIVNYGGVTVYLSFDNGASFESVPEVVGGIAYGSYYGAGYVNIDLYTASGSGAVTNPPTGAPVLVKIIITRA